MSQSTAKHTTTQNKTFKSENQSKKKKKNDNNNKIKNKNKNNNNTNEKKQYKKYQSLTALLSKKS